MFGYVVPFKEKLQNQDFVLYRSYYCGMCKSIGKTYGQLPRFTTNYDMTFLASLIHDIVKQDLEFENKGCVLNVFRKKITVTKNDTMDKISATNIILSYHKALDGVIDKEGGKMKFAKGMLQSSYKKALELLPGVDAIVKKWYDSLRELEQQNCSSVDRVADCFASLLRDVADNLLEGGKAISREKDLKAINSVPMCVVKMLNFKANDCKYCESCDSGDKTEPIKTEITDKENEVYYDNILSLFYNIGKFVYLADAIDDLTQDNKKGSYNPFVAKYGNFKDLQEFKQANKTEIDFILACTVNRVIESFNNISYRLLTSREMCRNIIYYGLRDKCRQLMEATKKLPRQKV